MAKRKSRYSTFDLDDSSNINTSNKLTKFFLYKQGKGENVKYVDSDGNEVPHHLSWGIPVFKRGEGTTERFTYSDNEPGPGIGRGNKSKKKSKKKRTNQFRKYRPNNKSKRKNAKNLDNK